MTTLSDEILANLPDNEEGLISPKALRQTLNDMLANFISMGQPVTLLLPQSGRKNTTAIQIGGAIADFPGHQTTKTISVNANPVGSGVNGPSDTDCLLFMNIIKQGFPNGGITGELDGIIIGMRNSGPSNARYDNGTASDTSAFGSNIGVRYGSGTALNESVAYLMNDDGGIRRGIDVQWGIVGFTADHGEVGLGWVVNTVAGTVPAILGDGFLCQAYGSDVVTNVLRYVHAGTGASFILDGAGGIQQTGGISLLNAGKVLSFRGSGESISVSPALGARSSVSVAANASLGISCPNAGLILYRDETVGGAAIVAVCDLVPSILFQTGTTFVTADPGPGGNKIFIQAAANHYGDAMNRFGVSHFISYTLLANRLGVFV